MFTGIIQHTGTIEKRDNTSLSVAVPQKSMSRLNIGASVAVNGTCLTVTKKTKNGFVADVMPETWKCTSLSALHKGCVVNLEFPLRLSDGLDGHIVQGHVDGMAELVSIEKESESYILTFSADKTILEYLVQKGSVTINGISLTLTSVTKKEFAVSIIPHTWKNTMLCGLGTGDKVNIEVDILAKYVRSFLKK